eukprot:749773-Hanusia_phi.AAC.3
MPPRCLAPLARVELGGEGEFLEDIAGQRRSRALDLPEGSGGARWGRTGGRDLMQSFCLPQRARCSTLS